MKYRPEIDGLRAVAVLPVVLFHAGFSAFSGGYVGVDVFFVISGYLITKILLDELEGGRLSLRNFYERRARRILPALFAVCLATLPFAWFWMFPAQLQDHAQGLVAVVLFASNILFWRETDYFAAAAELKPLLHTWSLAVEEQYYVLFPLLLLAIRTRTWRTKVFVVAGVAAASLLLAELASRYSPVANFFLLPTRAWEILAGALCALWMLKRPPRGNDAIAAAGLALIVAAVFLFDSGTRVPSVLSALPVLGACLLILFAGGTGVVGRLLSSRILVGVGLVSYSFYLWHQPIFAFARVRALTEPSPALMGALSVLALVAGWLTYRYVEKPFRQRGNTFFSDRKRFVACACAGLLLLFVAGLAGHLTRGAPARIPADVRGYLAAKDDTNPHRKTCHYRAMKGVDRLPELPDPNCVFGPGREPAVALLGDSHGDVVASQFATALGQQGVTATQITVSGCLPFSGYNRALLACDRVNRRIFDYVTRGGIKTVVLTGRYASLYHDTPFDNGEGGHDPASVVYDKKTFLFDLGPGRSHEDHALELMRRGVQRYLDAGLQVVLVYPIPEAGWDVPLYLAKSALHGAGRDTLSTRHDVYLRRYAEVIRAFDALEHPRLVKYRPDRTLCDTAIKGRCLNAWQGQVFYFDHNHLSEAGARFLVPGFVSAVGRLGRPD